MRKLLTNLDTILDVLSTICLIGACVSAVVMLYNVIGGRWNELMQVVPMSDDLVYGIVDCLNTVMPVVIVTWGFRIWWMVIERLKEKREEIEEELYGSENKRV